MLKRVAAVLGLSAFVAAAAAAIGVHETPVAAATAGSSFHWRSDAGTTIEIMLDSHPWQQFIEPFIPQFERRTGIRVDLSVYPENQFRTKRTVEMVSGTSSVDGFMIMPAEDLAEYTKQGWLAPLNGFMTSKSTLWPRYDLSDFFRSAREAGVKNGTSYTIPI